MTDIDLLDGLAEEIREALEGFQLRSAKDNIIPVNVYTQNPPLKEDKTMKESILMCAYAWMKKRFRILSLAWS